MKKTNLNDNGMTVTESSNSKKEPTMNTTLEQHIHARRIAILAADKAEEALVEAEAAKAAYTSASSAYQEAFYYALSAQAAFERAADAAGMTKIEKAQHFNITTQIKADIGVLNEVATGLIEADAHIESLQFLFDNIELHSDVREELETNLTFLGDVLDYSSFEIFQVIGSRESCIVS